MNYSKTYTFDFECTSREPSNVYMCSLTRLDRLEYDKTKTFLTLEDTINYIFSRQNNSTFFAHNLKYDISFILAHLFQNHRDKFIIKQKIIMPLTKSIFTMSIYFRGKTIKFRDSFCLFSSPLSDVMKAYTDFEKTETPIFDYLKDVTIDNEVLRYSKIDALALAIALTKRLTYGFDAITTASGAFKEFKFITEDRFGKGNFHNIFPIIEIDDEKLLRKAYRGGFTFLHNIFANVVCKDVNVIDVVSMYPDKMYNAYLPYGDPVKIDGEVETHIDELFNIGIQNFTVRTLELRDGFIPFLSNTNSFLATNVYIDVLTEEESVEKRTFSLTLQEFELFKRAYKYTDIVYNHGFIFKSRNDLFKEYIDKFWEMKSNENKSIKSLGKLFLNSLYGKFAEGYEKTDLVVDYEDKVIFKDGDVTIHPCGHLPIGIFITSYSRLHLLNTILTIGVENFIYCDTDSIHYTDNVDDSNIEMDDTKLGMWSYKCKYNRAFYIRPKRYCGEIVNKDGVKLDIACAGIKRAAIKTQITKFEDFKSGVEIKTIEFKQGINGQMVRDKVIKI